MKTLVISGSIRSREFFTDKIIDFVKNLGELEEYITEIKRFQDKSKPISNTDIVSGAALLAMRHLGAEIDFYPLLKLFPKREKKVTYTEKMALDAEIALTDTLALNDMQLQELIERIKSSHGVLLTTPVYFGDRSSVANKLLQLSGIHGLLKDKVFGCASVGAKRNGGQETTIIFSLFEALSQNALVVGNGPPTSQYGGTAVGGHRGTVLGDTWGLETSYGTGIRVAHVSEILEKAGSRRLKRPVKILVLVTMDDTEQTLYSFVKGLLDEALEQLPNVEFTVDRVLDSTIHRCMGCDECPAYGKLPIEQIRNKDNHSHCLIRNPEDAMERIQELLLDSDGIIVAGLNVQQHAQLLYRYQVLIERTRYIRRDHFELTDKLITAFSLNQVGARINALHSIKTITSYLRHNAIMHRPIDAFIYNGKVLDNGLNDLLNFARTAEQIAVGSEKVQVLKTEYTTKGIGGY